MGQTTDKEQNRPSAIPTHSHHHHHEHHEYRKYSWRWFRHKIKKVVYKNLKYKKYLGKKMFLFMILFAIVVAMGAVFIKVTLYEEDFVNAPQQISQWPDILKTYKDNPDVNQLLFIKCETQGSNAEAFYYIKSEDGDSWDLVSRGKAYIGVNGLGKRHEGDKKTPEGDFNVTGAFGIKENPGTAFDYLTINSYTVACDEDCEYYNQVIDVRKVGIHKGEVMIDCAPQYYYGMFLDYNPGNVRGMGSNIFLHCNGYSRYTAGCVAIEESMLLEILSTAKPGFKVCIHER